VHIPPAKTDILLKRRKANVERDKDEHPGRDDATRWDDPRFSINIAWRDHAAAGHLADEPRHPVYQGV
jgi:hypothetical protein